MWSTLPCLCPSTAGLTSTTPGSVSWYAHAFERWWIKLRMDLLFITVLLLHILVWSMTIQDIRWHYKHLDMLRLSCCDHDEAKTSVFHLSAAMYQPLPAHKLRIRNWTAQWWIVISSSKGSRKGWLEACSTKNIFPSVNPDFFQPSFYAVVYD